MRQQASDLKPSCNLMATSNQRPAWEDPEAALAGRILETLLEQPVQLDSSIPEQMNNEMHFILLFLLRSYYDLSKHVQTTPFKQWQHPLLFDSRRTQEAAHPLAEMLMDGEARVSVDGVQFVVRPEDGATVSLERLERIVNAWCDSQHRGSGVTGTGSGNRTW